MTLTVDDWRTLRDAARTLARLYDQLDAMKHTTRPPSEVRVSTGTRGGKPSTPGNWLYVGLGLDLEARLREVCFNVFADLGIKIRDDETGPGPLLELIVANAGLVADLEWSTDLLDELRDQTRILRARIHPPEPKEVANRPEPRQLAAAVIQRLDRKGYAVTREQLWQWTHRGYITARIRPDGKAAYLMSEILDHLEREPS